MDKAKRMDEFNRDPGCDRIASIAATDNRAVPCEYWTEPFASTKHRVHNRIVQVLGKIHRFDKAFDLTIKASDHLI